VMSAIARNIAPQITDPAQLWILNILLLLTVLWAISQSTITLYSGLVRIHTFSEKLAAWFTPLVLALGMGAGIGTWGILSTGL
jgi:hypothetical protein